ncbi:MAG: ankyrin repeat domain-containing protein [Candidatus Brocadiia bacterium]
MNPSHRRPVVIALVFALVCVWGAPLRAGEAPAESPLQEQAADTQEELPCNAELAAAAYAGDLETVQRLLEEGADPNSRWCPHDALTLHTAAFMGHTEIVELLLQHGADIAALDGQGYSALAAALIGGHPESVKLLVREGAHLAEADSAADAAARGEREAVVALLEAGADVSSPAEGGLTPLHCAVGAGRAEIARMLIEHGADVNATTRRGRTPLHLAAWGGNARLISLLLEAGADAEVVENSAERYTALAYAAIRNHREAVRALVEGGAALDPVQDRGLGTPLMAAAWHGAEPQTLGLLLELGGDPNATNHVGRTALHHAAGDGSLANVTALLEAGAKPSADTSGFTPLMLAVARAPEPLPIAERLLAAGADLSAADPRQNTLLHYAVRRGDADVVRWLVAQGASTDQKDSLNRTPLELAEQLGHQEAAEVLRPTP